MIPNVRNRFRCAVRCTGTQTLLDRLCGPLEQWRAVIISAELKRRNDTGAPTKDAFLAAYRAKLTRYAWAADAGKLDRFMVQVARTIRAADNSRNTWSPRGSAAAYAAWRALGGHGQMTLRALRALQEAPDEPNRAVD